MPSRSSSGIAWRGRSGQRCLVPMPGQPQQVLAQRADRVGIVLGEAVREPGHRGVHEGATEFFFGGDLAGRGLEQRRPGKEGAGPVAHHDHEVGHAGHVGAAGSGAAVHDGEHRNAGGREPGEARVVRTAADEVFDPIAQQVGAGRLDQVHEGQPVLERELLGALELLESHRLQRARFDAGIVDHHHATGAAHLADAGEQAAARRRLVRIGLVEQVARARRELEVRSPRVEQQPQPLARQQLPAPGEARSGPARCGRRALAQLVMAGDQRQHVRPVLAAGGARHVQRRLEDRHAPPRADR